VQPWLKAPCAIRMLERLAASLRTSISPRGPQRLFVRRPQAGHRALRNQDEIGALLSACGYATVTPGEMNFTQQVLAFADATHIVGTLGAECANLAFAPPGARCFGLAPSDMLDDFFWDLISHKDGAYFALHGPPEHPADGMNAAFTVDLASFAEMLDRFDPHRALAFQAQY
jgi:capsular polysaccharide biosynthesis protein